MRGYKYFYPVDEEKSLGRDIVRHFVPYGRRRFRVPATTSSNLGRQRDLQPGTWNGLHCGNQTGPTLGYAHSRYAYDLDKINSLARVESEPNPPYDAKDCSAHVRSRSLCTCATAGSPQNVRNVPRL
jgi:hypothetical protein